MTHGRLDTAARKRPLKIGLIGLGLISHWHIEAIKLKKNIIISALSDVNHVILAKKGQELGVKALYSDYRDMLKNADVDMVDIMTPHSHHAQCISDVLASQRMVICEKPLVTTIEDLNVVEKLSKKMNIPIYVKHYMRYSRAYMFAQELLLKESIGKPYYVQCTFTTNSTRDYANPHTWKGNLLEGGGGVFIDVGAHILDLLILLFGHPISTYGQRDKILTKLSTKGEDFLTAIVEFPKKIAANIVCTENDAAYGFRWEVRIYGTKGAIVIIDQGKEKKVLQHIQDNQILHEYVEDNWWEQSNIHAVEDILDRIQNGQAPKVPMEDIRSAIETIVATYESSSSGKKVLLATP